MGLSNPPGAKHRARLDLRLPPRPEICATTREIVRSLCERMRCSVAITSRAAVAAHELMENLVKYATGEDSLLSLEIEIDEHGTLIKISTHNRARREDAAQVEDFIREHTSSSSPATHYHQLLLRAAERTEGSGLGLCRISAEAEMHVSADVDFDRVTIVAHLEERRALQ